MGRFFADHAARRRTPPVPVPVGIALALLAFAPGALAEPGAEAQAAAQPGPQQSPEPKPPLPVVVEKIVVSATVAEEGHDPATLAGLDQAEIAERNRGQDLAMLLAETPNAYAYSDAGNGVGYSYLSLRGFDQRRIAVYVNGVPLNDPESQQVYFIDLADLAGGLSGIQVQRGTGTALYGSPAVGGVVNLETGAIGTEQGGQLVLGAGSFGTYRASAQYAWPLRGGRSAVSARLAHVRSDGYRDPSWTRHTLGELAYQRLSDDSVLRVRAFGGPEQTQLAYLGVPIEYLRGDVTGEADRDRRANPLRPGETDHFFQPQLQVLHDLRLREGLLLKNTLFSILGDGYFRQWRSPYLYAPLGAAPPSAAFPGLTLYDAWRKRSVELRQLGWVPSLSWQHTGGRLTGGLELRRHSGRHFGTVEEALTCAVVTAKPCPELGPPIQAPLTLYDYRRSKTTLVGFLRESLQPSRRLRLSLELQATRHHFSMDEDEVRGYSWDTVYSFVTPRLGVSFDATDRVNLYATLSAASSEPRFDDIWDPQDTFADPVSLFDRYDPARRHLEDAKARPERLRSAEIGAAYRSARARVKANLYWMDFRDELVYAGGIDEDGLPITDNAARSLHRGVEVEAALRLPWQLELAGWLAASRDLLEDYVLRFGPSPADWIDYSGNRVALFPDSQARLRIGRGFGPLRAELGLRRAGTIYLDNSENERKDPAAREQPGYVDKKIDPVSVADLRLALDLKRVLPRSAKPASLVLRVDNLFDERYAASGYAYGEPYFFPASTRGVYLGLSLGL